MTFFVFFFFFFFLLMFVVFYYGYTEVARLGAGQESYQFNLLF